MLQSTLSDMCQNAMNVLLTDEKQEKKEDIK